MPPFCFPQQNSTLTKSSQLCSCHTLAPGTYFTGGIPVILAASRASRKKHPARFASPVPFAEGEPSLHREEISRAVAERTAYEEDISKVLSVPHRPPEDGCELLAPPMLSCSPLQLPSNRLARTSGTPSSRKTRNTGLPRFVRW